MAFNNVFRNYLSQSFNLIPKIGMSVFEYAENEDILKLKVLFEKSLFRGKNHQGD